MPVSTISVAIYSSTASTPKPLNIAGSYLIASDDFGPFLNAVAGGAVQSVVGNYSMQRHIYSGGELMSFSGPLGKLGMGRSNPSSATVTFLPRAGVTVIFSRLKPRSVYSPPHLWTTATGQLQVHSLPIATDAAESLATFVQDADDVLEYTNAPPADYWIAGTYTRALVDDIVANAREDGRTTILYVDVERSKRRFCPMYPFCRKIRR
ncbi:MAG: hypothetical protein M3P06_20750 [Acidobacteriota bacterium]|nr:hypothetical protein [Acidobacteriota bacterium]